MFKKARDKKKSELEKIVATIDNGGEILKKFKSYSSKELRAMINFFKDQLGLFVDRYANNKKYSFIMNFVKDYIPSANSEGNYFTMFVTIRNIEKIGQLNINDPTISFTIVTKNDSINIGGTGGGCKVSDAMEFIALLMYLELEAEEREEKERKNKDAC